MGAGIVCGLKWGGYNESWCTREYNPGYKQYYSGQPGFVSVNGLLLTWPCIATRIGPGEFQSHELLCR